MGKFMQLCKKIFLLKKSASKADQVSHDSPRCSQICPSRQTVLTCRPGQQAKLFPTLRKEGQAGTSLFRVLSMDT